MNNNKIETATFGAGCFWCVEAVFQQLKGVHSVVSGYMGGTTTNPTYREICSGSTVHAEVTRIEYDANFISFDELLKVLWSTHDPTTLNQQGHDRGTQYRSVIFYHTENQRALAIKSIAEVASKLWTDPIVTEVVPATTFYPAEQYHQNYYNSNPNTGYCRAVINPKMKKFKLAFQHLIKEEISET
jgi:peptide-methionine (S)-S-oxide reductase